MPDPSDRSVTDPARVVRISDRFPRASTVPAGARVLTPDARLARVLRRAHGTPAGEAGRDLTRHGRDVAGPYARWRALGDAVRQEIGDADVPAWRRTLAGPVREALRAGLDRTELPSGVSAATHRALRVAARYRDLLAEDGAIDPAARYRVAVALGTKRRARPWAVLGVGHADPGFLRWLDLAAAPGTVLVLPPEATDAAEALAAAGWEVRRDDAPLRRSGERWARRLLARDAGVSTPGPAALRFSSQEEQLRFVAAETLRALDGGVPACEIAWIVRDPARVADAVRALAWETGGPFRPRVARTLADAAVGGVAASLADAIVWDAPFETTARTLRHRAVRRLDDEAWTAARARRPEGIEAWTRFEPRCAAWRWPRRAAPGAYLDRFRSALDALLPDREEAAPEDRAARDALDAALPELAAGARSETTPAAFRAELGDLLRLTPLDDHDDHDDHDHHAKEDAVEVLSFEAAAAGRWRRAWFLDLNEGIAPAPVRDAPVLDFADRARLRAAGAEVDDAARAAERETAAFAAALRAVDGPAVACAPVRGPDGTRLPSPYLDLLCDGPPVAPPERPPVGPEERLRAALDRVVGAAADAAAAEVAAASVHREDPDGPGLDAVVHAWRVERDREASTPFGRYDGITGRPTDLDRVAFSATSLAALGACPFRWFGTVRLGLRDAEELDVVRSPLLRGRLAHGTLERALNGAVATLRADGLLGPDGLPPEGTDEAAGQERLREEALAELPAAFAATEAALALPDGPAWRRARGAERRAIERLIRSDAFLSLGRWPSRFERPFDARAFGLRIRGIVDRVDVGGGDAELIDYKLGVAVPRGVPDRDGRGGHDLQLPLYLEVAAPEVAPERSDVRARYLSVRGAATVRTLDPTDGTDRSERDRRFLAALAAETRARAARGAWPVRPDARREACRTCDLAPVCRVGPRVDRKAEPSDVERSAT